MILLNKLYKSLNLNYKKYGSGPPIIILHGLFGMLDNWVSFARKLSENYTVYIIDLRNHGKSPHDDDMSYEVMAEDVYDFIHEQEYSAVHVMGHSMGGKVAMTLALNYGDVVQSLIVLDISPKAYAVGHREILEAMLDIDLTQMKTRDDIFQHLNQKIEKESTVQFLMKNISRSKQGSYHWKMNLPVINDSYPGIIDLVGAPWSYEGRTIFIKGTKSDYMEDDDAELIEYLFPNSSIKSVKDAGHWVHADQPQKLMELVVGFLSDK